MLLGGLQVEFVDGGQFCFKVSWAWLRRFVAGVKSSERQSPSICCSRYGVSWCPSPEALQVFGPEALQGFDFLATCDKV